MTEALAITTKFLAALTRCVVPHVIVGSFARNAHAFPRSTEDAEIVLALDANGLTGFEMELGEDFSLDAQISFATVTGTYRHNLTHRETEFKTELFLLSQDAFDQARFARRQPVDFSGHATFVLVAEDVIVSKLRRLHHKDWEDICDVIAVKNAALDWNYIHHWTASHGTRAKLDEIRATVPVID